jgi:hypothetical protein
MYHLLIEHRLDKSVRVEGNYQLLERLISAMVPADPAEKPTVAAA